MTRRDRILLIDQRSEWLQFAKEVLQEQYEVVVAQSFQDASECCMREGRSQDFDLVFIGQGLAASNLPAISQLSRSPSDGWRFIVMFPVFQEDESLRMFFKAGVLDCADKPYEREGLLKLVADELTIVKGFSGIKRFLGRPKQAGQGMLVLERMLDRKGGKE